MNSFTALKNRCAVVKTPHGDIFIENCDGSRQCNPAHLAQALGYRNMSPTDDFCRVCTRLGATHLWHRGERRCLLTAVIDRILPNITNALMARYKSEWYFCYKVGIEPCEFEHNVRIVKEILIQFMAENEQPEETNFPPKDCNDRDFSKLAWEDFSTLATWMAEEISSSYIMDKKSYQNQPADAPIHFNYRIPVRLCHEERTLMALFIKSVFWKFWQSGQTSGFNSQKLLRNLAWNLGMRGYETNTTLSTLCTAIAKKFPDFIKSIKEGDL